MCSHQREVTQSFNWLFHPCHLFSTSLHWINCSHSPRVVVSASSHPPLPTPCPPVLTWRWPDSLLCAMGRVGCVGCTSPEARAEIRAGSGGRSQCSLCPPKLKSLLTAFPGTVSQVEGGPPPAAEGPWAKGLGGTETLPQEWSMHWEGRAQPTHSAQSQPSLWPSQTSESHASLHLAVWALFCCGAIVREALMLDTGKKALALGKVRKHQFLRHSI